MPNPIRIVYFGTPAYAEPALRALSGDTRFDVRLVVTQPDRPGGRGHRLVAPRVKEVAAALGLPVFQPASLRAQVDRDHLATFDADVFVVAAYGLIFGSKTLALPRGGCVNLHASILPAYRGAAPIPAAILSGDAETGVTLMEMEAGLDTGPIVDIARTPIASEDTTETLTARLGRLGADLVVDALPRWHVGELTAMPQGEPASAVRMLAKADGGIDWFRPAVDIKRHVRAMWPWPRAWTALGGTVVQLHAASVVEDAGLEPGLIGTVGRRVIVGTGDGTLALGVVQLAGAKPIAAADAVRGGQLRAGGRFTSATPPELPLVRPA